MAAIYSLYVINKSGGLIFYKDYGSAGRMDTNDSLRMASLWHSMHAISQQLSPISGCSGIELLQADTFDLHCFQSLTGHDAYDHNHNPINEVKACTFSVLQHLMGSFASLVPSPNRITYLGKIHLLVQDLKTLPASRDKVFVVCDPGTQHMEGLLKHIYELYTDYVLKNPFYEMEMPIRVSFSISNCLRRYKRTVLPC
ncbi:hypothetical protein FNV43_RR10296 [Rhamnella rubrinervis]|uniref:Trafficking protein particle complex subunit n=1 Tax=Rhamnella rubrinervis TaxID=2594499 RepID=A0A8K0HBK2_9ROSA|nr:hypothetical protein FNV43_RR10296 [Rhamnella rubrinervis]